MNLTDEQIKLIADCCDPDDLPGDLPEVAEFLGSYKALLLGYHMGCGRIYLKRWSDASDNWSADVKLMVDTIGLDDAKIIVMNFNGAHIDIPKCDRFWKQWRNKIICSNKSRQVDLGRAHNLSDRWIRELKKRDRANDNQQDLFNS